MVEPVEILPTGAVKCEQNICKSSPYQRLAGDNCYCSPDKTISPTLCDEKRECESTQYLTFLNECKTLPEFCSAVVDGSGKCLTCTSPKVPNNAGECKDCTIQIVTQAELNDTDFEYPSDRKCLAEPFSASRVIPPYPDFAMDVNWAKDWGYLNPFPMNYNVDKTLRWETGVSEIAVNAASIAIAEYQFVHAIFHYDPLIGAADLSEQHILDCSTAVTPNTAFEFLIADKGPFSIDTYPMTDEDDYNYNQNYHKQSCNDMYSYTGTNTVKTITPKKVTDDSADSIN